MTITALGLIQTNIRFNFIPQVNVSPAVSHVYNSLLARSLTDSKVATCIAAGRINYGSSMKIKCLLTLFLCLLACRVAHAQDVAVKTNLLDDVTLTLNGGVEVKTAPKWTVDLSGNLNAWTVDNRRWKHWLVQPEARYWFCDAFSGHFVGGHLLGGQYNWGNLNLPFKFLGTDFSQLKDYRHQGWMAGAGVVYGYSWIINRHWNIEAVIGLGWVYTRYDVYECADCGKKVKSRQPHNYVGPTKVAIDLVYTF